jgi:hypothetical protein
MRNLALAVLLVVLSGCVPTIEQRKLIVRGSSGQKLATDALIVRLAAGVEGDLTLITDFKLSDLKRR